MSRVEYVFDPFELVGIDPAKLKGGAKDEALDEIADFVLESVLTDVGNQKSPVTGREFKRLSKDYAEKKKAEGGTPVPNLEMEGDLMDSVRVKKRGRKLVLTVDGELEQLKADNHNKFSPESKATAVPARKFIPNAEEGESFRPDIRRGIKELLSDYLEDDA